MRHEAHGVAEPLRRTRTELDCSVAQESRPAAGKHQLRRAAGDLAPEQSHDPDAPRDYGVDPGRPRRRDGRVVQRKLDAVTGILNQKETSVQLC